jgi:hypothetical protein
MREVSIGGASSLNGVLPVSPTISSSSEARQPNAVKVSRCRLQESDEVITSAPVVVCRQFNARAPI